MKPQNYATSKHNYNLPTFETKVINAHIHTDTEHNCELRRSTLRVGNQRLQSTDLTLSKCLWPWMRPRITDWHRVGPQITHGHIRQLKTCHLFTTCCLREISDALWQ